MGTNHNLVRDPEWLSWNSPTLSRTESKKILRAMKGTKTEMMWTARSKNPKTGDIPQGYVGQTRELARKSCKGCALLKKPDNDEPWTPCYFWYGSAQMGHISMTKGYAKRGPEAYSLEAVLPKAARSANYARGGVGGDPWVFTRETVKGWFQSIKDAGLRGLLLYCHFPDKAAHLKGLAMASCNLDEADDLVDQGWRTAAILPFKYSKLSPVKAAVLKDVPEYDGRPITTKAGRKVVVCPAQTNDRTTCNDCGLCDASKEAADVIGFLQH